MNEPNNSFLLPFNGREKNQPTFVKDIEHNRPQEERFGPPSFVQQPELFNLEFNSLKTHPLPESIAQHPFIENLTELSNQSQAPGSPIHQSSMCLKPIQRSVPVGAGSPTPTNSLFPIDKNNANATENKQVVAEYLPPKFLDITPYLNMPQTKAASKLGIPTSTLSKRWREAARQRKWPWRTVCKIDKEIITLLHNIPPHASPNEIPKNILTELAHLLKKRESELQPVVIRLH